MFKSEQNPMFRSKFSEDIFLAKYRHDGCETWAKLAKTLVEDVCQDNLNKGDKAQLTEYITQLKYMPGGRYLYYAGRPKKFFNNCYTLRAEEDTREDWANLSWRVESCLLTGGGIGVDYSVYRPANQVLGGTGGISSGPLPKMHMINETGRSVIQGGARRSALYASLSWKHGDINAFLKSKNWHEMPVPGTKLTLADLKQLDFDWPCPLDMTNISVNYDTEWLMDTYLRKYGEVFIANVLQAVSTGEPGLSFNFFDKEKETLRNAPVSADTCVLTSEGYHTIRDIVGTKIKIWTGRRWADTVFRCTEKDVQTISVKMSGEREIKADPNHEFFIRKIKGAGETKTVKVEKVAAKNLRVGDELEVSLPSVHRTSLNLTYYTYGFIFGDGSFNRKYPSSATVTFCTEEKKKCFRLMETEYPFTHVNYCDKRGYITAYLKDKLFETFSKEQFPLNISDQHLSSFIAGLFDSDGTYAEDRGAVRFSSNKLEFLHGLRRALEQLSIQSYISSPVKSGYGGKLCYNLVVASSSTTAFSHYIPTQRLAVKKHKAYRDYFIKVKALELGPVEDVYCCDVKVQEHSFCAEGVIISNCTEITSEDDSDPCNLGSPNLSRIENINEFRDVVDLATKFLVCGTLRADVPYEKVNTVRGKNRRLGLGEMGCHEWLLQRGYNYEVVPELHNWLSVYRGQSRKSADAFCDKLGISRPIAYRAIAPNGTIGILAGTTTGIEPVFATAYKRRYIREGNKWVYQYVVDSTAQYLIDQGISADKIESSLDLAKDYERRIKFQADVQDYVDQAISSTINLPKWGSRHNNEDTVDDFAKTLAKYAPRLRGFTCYPDGARGGQPLTPVPYEQVKDKLGEEFEEQAHDICDITGHGGSCGV